MSMMIRVSLSKGDVDIQGHQYLYAFVTVKIVSTTYEKWMYVKDIESLSSLK